MRELVHVLLGNLVVVVPDIQPSLQPSVKRRDIVCVGREKRLTPSGDVCNRVFACAYAGEIFFDLASVFTREMELEDAVDAEDFILGTLDGDYIQPTISNAYQVAV